MSEYQRYEFMNVDRPLTRAQLDKVEALSSHIEASPTHALIEYEWGDFKHDPIKVLHQFFDGFLYWANWGAPELALRFPHGVLPANLIDDYDFDDYVAFAQHADYDILDINFGEMESPEEWIDYDLGSLISIRDELMDGDLRTLYILWLAVKNIMGTDNEEEDYEISVPPVPPAFGSLTITQRALADLFQVPQDLLASAAQHSTKASASSTQDDMVALVKLLPAERRDDYIVRLAHNEPGLSRLLIRELHELNRDLTREVAPAGERVTYATLLKESTALKAEREHAQRKREQAMRLAHLQDVHKNQDAYWKEINEAVVYASGANYDKAVRLLVDLREAARQFQTDQEFEGRFSTWVRSYSRRPALISRLKGRQFPLPEA